MQPVMSLCTSLSVVVSNGGHGTGRLGWRGIYIDIGHWHLHHLRPWEGWEAGNDEKEEENKEEEEEEEEEEEVVEE